jgi:hypothetical protein
MNAIFSIRAYLGNKGAVQRNIFFALVSGKNPVMTNLCIGLVWWSETSPDVTVCG